MLNCLEGYSQVILAISTIYIGSTSAGCHQRLVTKTGHKCFNGENQQFAQQQSSNENLNKNHKLLIIDIPMLDATDDREEKTIIKKWKCANYAPIVYLS